MLTLAKDNKLRYFFAFAALWLCPSSHAEDHVWVIGGGPNVDDAGFQIEYNIKWVLDVLNNAPHDRQIHIYFGAGGVGEKDVVEWSPSGNGEFDLQPMARVFGQSIPNGETYRESNIESIAGSTSRGELTIALKNGFRSLQPGDRAFIIYNGHGLHDEEDAGNNTIRLWDNTRLTAREFESLLSEIEPTIPTRFLFAQCYSGGFARLIHPRGDDVLDLAGGNRCGFMAAPDDKQSEGCSSSTKLGDYRDYTTHFFAAFSGKTKQGVAVSGSIDMDEDGITTMFDAHLFALKNGYSRSVPRATSETFLERWQPWYLRWMDTGNEPDNLYGRLSFEVGGALGLPSNKGELIKELAKRRKQFAEQIDELENEKEANEHRSKLLQESIRKVLISNWPEVAYPYTDNFRKFVLVSLEEANKLITGRDDYAELVALQERQLEIDATILGRQRDVAEIEKVRRLRKLARLSAQFSAYANEKDRRSYEQLLSCEKSGL